MKNQWKKYLGVCFAAFLTFLACMIAFFAVFKMHQIAAVIGKIIGILEPILIGIVIAYLLNPVMNFFEKHILRGLSGTKLGDKKKKTIARSISVGLAILFGVAVVVSVFGLMLPQLITSIYGIAREMPGHINDMSNWILEISKNNPALEKMAVNVINEVADKLNYWFTSDLLVYVTRYLGYLTTGVISAVSTVLNVVIGLIVAVYVLYSREVFAGQSKKLIYTIFAPERANVVLDTMRRSNQIFGGFITGKILDSAIIGILSFICLSFMDMPYTLLISVIVGVTNVIPFFGPYIGAIPSALIILLVDPIKAVYFLIFILILQQVDGNIIGPKILGESTGLSAFWVVFAILLGGGLFGIPGLIIGVPTFGVIYYIVKTIMDYILRKKGYPQESGEYVHLKKVDKDTRQMVFYEIDEIQNPPKFFKLSLKKYFKEKAEKDILKKQKGMESQEKEEKQEEKKEDKK
ncbi:MAG: AI-2E family transporter [Lachnospiraceae bacterium]|nr:AI-2E family transporter [Lachnospiraceae bacterium]